VFGWVEIGRRPSGLTSIADILLHRRELALGAKGGHQRTDSRNVTGTSSE
jgi:hypothetical protein